MRYLARHVGGFFGKMYIISFTLGFCVLLMHGFKVLIAILNIFFSLSIHGAVIRRDHGDYENTFQRNSICYSSQVSGM